MSDFRLVLVSVAPFLAALRASLAERVGRVEVEVEVGAGRVFVVHPVFFGWDDLAEEKQK